jgi:hypothetical protein
MIAQPRMIDDVETVFTALGNSGRMCLLLVLANGPKAFETLQRELGINRELLTRHLKDLRRVRLVSRPHGEHHAPWSLHAQRVRVTDDEICFLVSGFPITIGRNLVDEGDGGGHSTAPEHIGRRPS